MRGDRVENCFVLAAGSLGSAGLRQQGPADAFKMGADRIEDLANSHETQALGHLTMKPGVEFVETLKISAGDGRLLVGEILTKRRDRIVRHAGRADPDNFDLQCAPQQHPLPHILKVDLGHVGAALRLDHHKPLKSEPVDRGRDREPGYVERDTPLVLVDRSVWRERARDDGSLERRIGLVDFRPARPASSRCSRSCLEPAD